VRAVVRGHLSDRFLCGRLVLFCSWLPVAQLPAAQRQEGRRSDKRGASEFAAATQQSETDYSFYDTHLEPKLRLSERARRSLSRTQSDGSPRAKRRR